jgi:hypothetical protein
VSQTDGVDLPNMREVSGDPGDNIDRLAAFLKSKGIQLVYRESLDGALGKSYGGRIDILSGQSNAEEFSTLVHETAHELLHKTERRTATTKTVSPRAELVDHLKQTFPQWCQLIAHRDRDGWNHLAGDKTILLQMAEGLGQHLLRDILEKTTQFVKTHAAVLEGHEDQDRPLVGDAVDHLTSGAVRTEDIEGQSMLFHPVTFGYLYH